MKSVKSGSIRARAAKGVRKRRLTGYKFFMKVCIKEMKRRYPTSTIILPLVSRLSAKSWGKLSMKMKNIFQLEADYCEKERYELGLDDYDIQLPVEIDESMKKIFQLELEAELVEKSKKIVADCLSLKCDEQIDHTLLAEDEEGN